MLQRWVLIFLVIASLAPVALIWGIRQFGKNCNAAWAWIGVAIAAIVVCGLILTYIRIQVSGTPFVVKKSKSLDKDAFSFLVTYALPLVVPTDKTPNAYALGAFIFFGALVLIQLQIAYVNPTIALFGFRFYEVTDEHDETNTLIAKTLNLKNIKSVYRIAPHVLLEIDRE